MKLEGYRRLEAHVPTDLWDEVEKARGQMTRSEFTRQALRAQLDYPSMLGAPNGDNGVAKTPMTAEKVSAAMKGAAGMGYPAMAPPAKTAREILQERTRLMRGNNS